MVWPPGEMTERLAAYANAHGRPSSPRRSTAGRPAARTAADGTSCGNSRHAQGVTNVSSMPAAARRRAAEGHPAPRRAAGAQPDGGSSAHLNQKPLSSWNA